MAWVSDRVIEAMGFERHPDGLPLAARFHSLNIFSISGMKLDTNEIARFSGILSGHKFEVGIGVSVNTLARALSGDDYADDEGEWTAENRCAPPYAMIHIGPTKLHKVKARFSKIHSRTIDTYNSFIEAKNEIRKLDLILLTRIIAATNSSFIFDGRPSVNFKFIDVARFGITKNGETIRDMSINFSASASSSSTYQFEEYIARIDNIGMLAESIDSRSASFFHLAILETDPLKKFLFLFISIEIFTHYCFKSSNHINLIESISSDSNRELIGRFSFFQEVKQWKNIRDRFIWCATFKWTNLVESDILKFLELKKVRDDIAHGNIASPNDLQVDELLFLSKKLYSMAAN